jgi:hypothetical protein
MFPPAELNKLYIAGSLKNIENGFEFSIQNMIDSASFKGLGPLLLDGQEIPLQNVTAQAGEQVLDAGAISDQNRLTIYYGAILTIRVRGQSLSAGEHIVKIAASSVEIGKVKFEIKEILAGDS